MMRLFKAIGLFTGLLLSTYLWAESPSMTVKEVHAATSSPNFTATLVDVRTPEEFAEGHIEGSINVPVGNLADYIEDLQPLDRKGLIVYCRSGRRAARAISMLKEVGFENVTHMQGDMGGWYDAELPVVVTK